MSNKKKYLQWVQWLLVVAAYAYLIYRLVTYDNYSSLVDHFHSAGVWQYVALVCAIALFPINILAESLKWRYLLSEIEPMSIQEALRQTYFGFVGAFLTPSRLGDYPARVTLMHDKSNWLSAITLGFIGTLALAFVQVLCGLPSCIYLFSTIITNPAYRLPLVIICSLTLLLQIVFILFYPNITRWLLRCPLKYKKMRLTLEAISRFSHQRFLTTCLLSVLRYAVYCLQLWCVMVFCGINLSPLQALVAITAYYLLVTVTPSVPIADAAVRGSWSIIIFGAFTDNIAGVAIAAILLWVLNSILPMIVGTFEKKK